MTRRRMTQQGVASIEAAGVIAMVLAMGFLLFDFSQAIRIHNRVGQTTAMLADAATTIDPTADVPTLTENINHLKMLAAKLDAIPKELRVTILDKPAGKPVTKQQYGGDISSCSPTTTPENEFTLISPPQSEDYTLYVIEVCYEAPNEPKTPSFVKNIPSPFSQLLPAYGISHAVGR